MNIEKVKQLRDKTGDGMMRCNKALIKADGDINVAQEYLRLTMQALYRAKIVNGERVRWNDDDYLEEARRIASEVKDDKLSK